jgi:hypothetical protein
MFFTIIGDMVFLGSGLYPLAWMVTNTGFLMVLYSRLHLFLDSPRVLKGLLFLIIGVGVPLQIFMIVAGTGTPHHLGDAVWQVTFRLEMIFIVFEIILSAMYVYLFTNFIRLGSSPIEAHLKRTICFLVLAEIFVVAGDVAIMTLWYKGLYLLRLALSSFIYALKLKVEFMVLNRLTIIKKRKTELTHITVSVTREEAVTTATGVEGEFPYTVDSKNVKSGAIEKVTTVGRSTTPCEEIREVSTSMTEPDYEKERCSFDEIERRYLGRFSRMDDMV